MHLWFYRSCSIVRAVQQIWVRGEAGRPGCGPFPGWSPVLSEENRPWRLGRVFSTQLGGKGTLYPGGVFAKPPELILKWLRFWQTEEVLTQTRVYFKGNVIRKMLSQLAGRLCRAIKILVAELFGEIKRGYIRVNMQTSTWTPHPSPLLGPGEPTLRYWGHQTQCEMDTFRDPGGASYHSLQSCT